MNWKGQFTAMRFRVWECNPRRILDVTLKTRLKLKVKNERSAKIPRRLINFDVAMRKFW